MNLGCFSNRNLIITCTVRWLLHKRFPDKNKCDLPSVITLLQVAKYTKSWSHYTQCFLVEELSTILSRIPFSKEIEPSKAHARTSVEPLWKHGILLVLRIRLYWMTAKTINVREPWDPQIVEAVKIVLVNKGYDPSSGENNLDKFKSKTWHFAQPNSKLHLVHFSNKA